LNTRNDKITVICQLITCQKLQVRILLS